MLHVWDTNKKKTIYITIVYSNHKLPIATSKDHMITAGQIVQQ